MTDPAHDVEQLMRQARRTSNAPAVGPGMARTVMHRARRRQRVQSASIGGAAAVVVAGGAVVVGHHGSTTSGAPVGVAPSSPAAAPTPPSSASSAAASSAPGPTPSGSVPAASTTVISPLPVTADCRAVRSHLAAVAAPAGYVTAPDIPPGAPQGERYWVHDNGVPTSLGVTVSCQEATPPTMPPGLGTVTSVTVQGHRGWLVTSDQGRYAEVLWSPNASTQVVVDANGLHLASFGNVSAATQKKLRLSDAALLAYAETVPTS